MPFDMDWYNPNLPDSRPKISRGDKFSKVWGWMEKIFCVNCGKDGGVVTRDSIPFVLYLCDDCAQKHGHLPLPVVPDKLVRGEK
jgi:hypothetical protein